MCVFSNFFVANSLGKVYNLSINSLGKVYFISKNSIEKVF